MATYSEIPIDIKEKLLKIAKSLPAAAQSEFVKTSTKKVIKIASDNESALVYGVLGFSLGELTQPIGYSPPGLDVFFGW